MRSESEIRWCRVKNLVGDLTKVSDWHAIVPGVGNLNIPPGVACSTPLTGSIQFAAHSAVRSLDGRMHEECMVAALDFLAEINHAEVDASPNPTAGPAPESSDREGPGPDAPAQLPARRDPEDEDGA